MTSVGETLRAERLKRHLALDEISQELKISLRFLNAIETGDYTKLPGGVFTKSFVRQYARLLGLDEEELAGQVQRVLDPPPEVPHPANRPKVADSGFHVPKMEAWESVGESRFHWSGSLSAAALFVVALLICSGVYTWMQRPHAAEPAPVQTQTSTQAAPPAPQPAVPAAAAPTTTPESAAAQPPSEPIVTGVPAPQPSSPAAANSLASNPVTSNPLTRVAQSDPNAAIRVAVTAGEPVWVLARSDGKFSFSGTLEANQTRMVEATGMVMLKLGNAGGVTITLNGKPIGPVGPKGQVRTVQFTSGGFQIVPAKPAADLDPL